MSKSTNTVSSPELEKKGIALWKKILGGAVVAIAIIIFIAMWATSGLMDPINRHLDALRNGNMEAAYAETSGAFRQNTSIEQYSNFVKQYPILIEYTDSSFSSRSVENNIGNVKGTLTASDGTIFPIEFKLVKENDAWVILGLNLGN